MQMKVIKSRLLNLFQAKLIKLTQQNRFRRNSHQHSVTHKLKYLSQTNNRPHSSFRRQLPRHHFKIQNQVHAANILKFQSNFIQIFQMPPIYCKISYNSILYIKRKKLTNGMKNANKIWLLI